MTVKIYRSTDPDAPVLTGEAGTLIAVLDACLVNGFSSRSITSITRSGDVATATTSTAHGLVIGTVIPIRLLISGANEAAYNGEFLVTPLTTDTFSYTVAGTPATPATGTITSKRPGLGFSKAFAGTSKAAYRMPAGTTQNYLQVLDDKTSTSQRSANLRSFVAMTSVDAGTDASPTLWCYKSATQNNTARAWRVIGDEAGFYLQLYPFGGTDGFTSWFGDIESYRVDDAYKCAIIGGTVETTVTTASGSTATNNQFPSMIDSLATTAGHYLARSYNQIGSAVAFGKVSDAATAGTILGQSGPAYPSPVDNGYHIARIPLSEGAHYRGILPGAFQPLHTLALSDGNVVENIVGLPGRVIYILALVSAASDGRVAIDLTGPWTR